MDGNRGCVASLDNLPPPYAPPFTLVDGKRNPVKMDEAARGRMELWMETTNFFLFLFFLFYLDSILFYHLIKRGRYSRERKEEVL